VRHTAEVLASNFVPTLAAVGVSAVEPGRAEAASTVKSCTGGDARLGAVEKQMLELHDKERASCASESTPNSRRLPTPTRGP
jgi:hypothetical protein